MASDHALAGLPPLEACALEAESPAEPHSRYGIATEFLNPTIAVPACMAAAAQSPDDRLVWFRLGRALEAQQVHRASPETRRQAMDAYARGAELGDPRSQLALARIVGETDAARASRLLAQADQGLRIEADAGSPQAMLMLGHASLIALAEDDVFDFQTEGEAARSAGILIQRARDLGVDRLLYDIHYSLQASGFCKETKPELGYIRHNARARHCEGLRADLDYSREPVVAYEMANDRLRYVHAVLTSASPGEAPDTFYLHDDVVYALEMLTLVADSDNPRAAGLARRQLPEVQKLEEQVRPRERNHDGEYVAGFLMLLGGIILVAGFSRASGSNSGGYAPSPSGGYDPQPLFRECAAVDHHGLVYSVMC